MIRKCPSGMCALFWYVFFILNYASCSLPQRLSCCKHEQSTLKFTERVTIWFITSNNSVILKHCNRFYSSRSLQEYCSRLNGDKTKFDTSLLLKVPLSKIKIKCMQRFCKWLFMMRPRFMTASIMYAKGCQNSEGCGSASQDRNLDGEPITLNENISSTCPCIFHTHSCKVIIFTPSVVAYTSEITFERGPVEFVALRFTGGRLNIFNNKTRQWCRH